MKWYIKRLLVAAALIAIIVIFHMSGIKKYINLSTIQEHRLYLHVLVANHYALSILIYILIITAIVACSLPLAALSTIVGGYLFGALPAAVFVNVGATLGSLISFLIFRYLIGQVVQERYGKHLNSFNKAFGQNGTSYLLVIHFITIFPLFLINILAGLTKVPVWTFIWTTSLGIFPASLVFAYAGTQLCELNSISAIFTWQVVLAFLLLALLGVMPTLLKRLNIIK